MTHRLLASELQGSYFLYQYSYFEFKKSHVMFVLDKLLVLHLKAIGCKLKCDCKWQKKKKLVCIRDIYR